MALTTSATAAWMRGQLVVLSTTMAMRRAQVLLILQIQIGRDQHAETICLGSVEQLAILEPCPAALVGRGHVVFWQKLPQRRRRSLIEEDAHSSRGQGAERSVFEHGARLFESDSREPLDELRDGRAVFQVLEQGSDGDACPTKHPGATQAFGIALDSVTG